MPEELNFRDYFSSFAGNYAAARPTYPRNLFEFVAKNAPSRERVWDCATGSGQAAVGLSEFFSEVRATDASDAQIDNAIPRDNIEYSIQLAEETNFPDSYFDAVTIAQALHWFDLKGFGVEAARVLRPSGVIFAWVYGFFSVTPEIDAVIEQRLKQQIQHLWKKGNEMAKRGYVDIHLPFPRLEVPKFYMHCDWDLRQLFNYVSTWSALNRYVEKKGPGIIEDTIEQVAPIWGHESEKRRVLMDFYVLGWRNDACT
jgi:ubiquinone/menaquinone biosynthesis C-methylase UbiE